MIAFKKADFVIDSIPGAVFSGYTTGDSRNGWACPYFEQAEAERILRASEHNGFQWRYDAAVEAFVVCDEQADETTAEVFETTTIGAADGPRRVYPIGAYSWIWELVDLE